MSYEELRELDREIKAAEDHLRWLKQKKSDLMDKMAFQRNHNAHWAGGDPYTAKRYICP